MPAVPCANHPKELTLVRCGRCDKPICTRCMVDSPVGKRCRDCARPKHHLAQTTPRQVALAFAAATVTALLAGVVLHTVPLLILGAVIYGYVVAEAALWAGKRGRGLSMQVAAGLAAAIGVLVGLGVVHEPFGNPGPSGEIAQAIHYSWRFGVIDLMNLCIGVASSVSRIRFW